MHVCLCELCAPLACRGRRASELLELEFQEVVSHLILMMGTTPGKQVLLTAEPFHVRASAWHATTLSCNYPTYYILGDNSALITYNHMNLLIRSVTRSASLKLSQTKYPRGKGTLPGVPWRWWGREQTSQKQHKPLNHALQTSLSTSSNTTQTIWR